MEFSLKMILPQSLAYMFETDKISYSRLIVLFVLGKNYVVSHASLLLLNIVLIYPLWPYYWQIVTSCPNKLYLCRHFFVHQGKHFPQIYNMH
jgi:hypothetical protein